MNKLLLIESSLLLLIAGAVCMEYLSGSSVRSFSPISLGIYFCGYSIPSFVNNLEMGKFGNERISFRRTFFSELKSMSIVMILFVGFVAIVKFQGEYFVDRIVVFTLAQLVVVMGSTFLLSIVMTYVGK